MAADGNMHDRFGFGVEIYHPISNRNPKRNHLIIGLEYNRNRLFAEYMSTDNKWGGGYHNSKLHIFVFILSLDIAKTNKYRMKFSTEINQFISGEKFSSALQVPFSPEKFEDLNRVEKVVSITQNKRVVHIGCADHLPLIEEKIKKNKWLHKLLIENTEKCIGIDINREAIDYMTHKLNIDNLHCLDIMNDDIDLADDETWDYVILGELIEHVDNPVIFLQTIREKFRRKAKKILITAPNVLNIFCANYIRKNIEYINTDHRYWFTPYTLTKTAAMSGFANCEISFAEIVKLPLPRAGIRFIKSKLNMKRFYKANCFSTVIVVADFE